MALNVSASTLRSLALSVRRRAGRAWRDHKGYRLNELTEAIPEFELSDFPPRINFIIVSLSARRLFGGTATAIRLLKAIESYFDRSRIVVLAEDETAFEEDQWPGWVLESRSPSARRTIAYASTGKLVVTPGDRFVATHWRTAYFLSSMRKALAERRQFKELTAAYLIQDFEPGFYPWGSSYVLAELTYRSEGKLIAIFNTNLLKEYFDKNGYRFSLSYVFEPSLNPKLASYLRSVQPGSKRKLILVYGRPSSARNAFGLSLEGLILWAQNYPRAHEWEVLSLGEAHKDIRLAPGVILRSKGKATLEAYGSWLADAAIGLSLMVSPHPSYPPLEMAEFSVRVITNGFGGSKDLSKRSQYITSLSQVTPVTIAAAIAEKCLDFERSVPEKTSIGTGAFLGGSNEFPFAEELANTLKGQASDPPADVRPASVDARAGP